MKYVDLKNVQALCETNNDTEWLKIEHGVICGLDKVVIMAMTRDAMLSLIAELLDHRARNLDSILMEGDDELKEDTFGGRQ